MGFSKNEKNIMDNAKAKNWPNMPRELIDYIDMVIVVIKNQLD